MGASPKELRRVLAMSALALSVGACSTDATDLVAPPEPELNSSYDPSRVRLAKIGPAGTTATFYITATGGSLPLGNTVTLNACVDDPAVLCNPAHVWLATDLSQVEVTITEIAWTGNLVLDWINVVTELEGSFNIFDPITASVTVHPYAGNSILVRFKNVPGEEPPPPPPPPPPPGSAGCTPGFWKQSQHFQYWTAPYTPETLFDDVFDNAFPGMTLLDVLKQGGGDFRALGRHTVAALLNGADDDVDYGWGAQHVIDAFNAAYASGDPSPLHSQLEEWNERGCTAKD